jgi:hypothetical protein
MKKFLLILVVGFLVATAVSYFGMQWRLKKSVDEAFAAMFFVDAAYDRVSIDFNGRISLRGLNLYIPATQTEIDVTNVGIETGGFWNTLSLEKNFEAGQLPETLKLDIQSFSMNIDPTFVDSVDQFYVPDVNAQLMALGCGRNLAMGPRQMFDMGLRSVTFDLNLGYQYDIATDQLVGTLDFYLDGISHLRIDQTYIGMGGLLQNYQSALFGFDPAVLTPVSLDIEYIDLGYNAKRRDFCSTAAGMDETEWDELNVSMFAEALNQMDFDSNFDILRLYADVLTERARVSVSLKPMPGFSMADLEFYDVTQLIELVDLNVIVNNEAVDVEYVSWDADRLASLDLAQIRRDFRVGPREEVVQSDAEEAEQSTQSRILREVPVTELSAYLNRQVLIERKNGSTFNGELISVTGDTVVVRTRFRSGFTDLPLVRADIATAKIYPE